MGAGAVIKVEGLSKNFGALKAVDGISFEVGENSIFGFLGPNGAGKTTTINILCTLLRPSSGRAFVNGFDCDLEPRRVRESIGIVFQDTTLDKDLTAYENLAFHAYLYGVKKSEIPARVGEALGFMDLADRKDDLVKKFSGGMKRRLEIARGMIHKPKVLFLDEPTLGLDPQSRENLWQAVAALPEAHGMTVFMTTHYMEEAEVCGRLAIIDHGRIIAEGSPSQLKSSIGGEVLIIKTKDNRKAEEETKRLFGIDAANKGDELHIPLDEKCQPCVPRIIKELADSILNVRLERPTLNDVFLKLTGKEIRREEVSNGSTIKEEIRAYRRRH
jgi:ABC-2 type transport system ATP-binding protein